HALNEGSDGALVLDEQTGAGAGRWQRRRGRLGTSGSFRARLDGTREVELDRRSDTRLRVEAEATAARVDDAVDRGASATRPSAPMSSPIKRARSPSRSSTRSLRLIT